MIYWLFILWMPFLHGTEVNWQADQKECKIDLKIVNHSIEWLQPLLIQAILECPKTYEINSQSLIDHLTQHVNIIQPQIRVSSFKTSLNEVGDRRTYEFDFQLRFLSSGNFLISFLNLEFISTLENQADVIIYTPIFEIKVAESKKTENLSITPLINLEPKLPLFISNENKQYLFSPERLATEEVRNVRIMHAHSLPWRILLALTLFLVLGYLGIKYQQVLFQKDSPKKQSESLKKRTEDKLFILKNEFLQHGNAREIYFKLSKLCSGYLSENFNKKISIFSENEIEHLVNTFPMPSNTKERLSSFLKESFYMKFSNQQPTLEQCENAFKVVEKIIN